LQHIANLTTGDLTGSTTATPHPHAKGSPRRRRRREVAVKPVDDVRESKKWKVIEEFLEMERAYVDGLELIYSVSAFTAVFIPSH
jgi:hypothetical protein